MKQKSRIIGRLLRFALGIFFVFEVWPVYRVVTAEGILIRLGWVLGLILFYIFLHFLVLRMASHLNSFVGAIIGFVPLILVFFIGYGDPAATGALTFLALSLILAAVRADPGCEVMSIPAIFLGKHTHLACLLFSPVDWIEHKFHT